MDGSRGAALRRARSAALVGLAVAVSAACSGAGDGGNGEDADRAARPPGSHSWTGRPCALLRGASPADGFALGTATDSASPGAREDIGEDGARARYRRTGCLAALRGPDGSSWKLTTTASVYEGARAARQAYRARENLDQAHGRGPEKVHADAYAIPADDRGRPGRTLLLRNGDLVLTVSAYAPYGSTARDVRRGLEQIVEGAAHRTERGLRASGSPAP
ncbi:hypothetical protein ADK88_06155 [Streptomyces sp. NRRL F-2295]|uniref:hypothetical protein n=1 Tax=Streptomyces sp. NRRL F-2295 TaxID=1519477 RepID=UPI0006AD9ADC|nr:hypothetical protein [Streptomyces sp. NRRL F-2295]KOU08659.1 hypothetical protein ADK88_06155 [Streptomyces sp. NRRL F-2295]